MFTLIDSGQLYQQAHSSQLRARSEVATPDDVPLVYVDEAAKPETHSNRIREMSRSQAKAVQDMLKTLSTLRQERGEGADAYEIRRIRGGQRSDCMTQFEVDGMKAECYLPGGAPLVDHLRARVEQLPDWSCLQPALEKLSNHRLPDLDRPASQREFTLGVTSEAHVQAAMEFLKASMKLIKNLFCMCLLAGDTESVGVVTEDYDTLLEDEVRTSYTFRVAKSRESATPLPVVLMVGHVGWQVHVMLPINATTDASGRKIFTMVPGVLQKGVTSFFKAMGTLTGVGITKDLEEFCELTQRLYGVDLSKPYRRLWQVP